ncbi:MAG: hypothetical protein ABIS08_04010 [Pseudolysinimonas sp.]
MSDAPSATAPAAAPAGAPVGGDIKIALPGSWWNIPLDDSAASAATVRTIVDNSVGRADDRVMIRRALREELQKDVETARVSGAHGLYLAREIASGIPMSGSLAVFWPRLSNLPEDADNAQLLRAAIKAALAERAPDEEATFDPAETREFESVSSSLLRRVRRHTIQDANGNPSTTIQCDYWIAFEEHSRPVLLSFSSSLMGMDEKLIGLFDAIAATATWVAQD